MLLGKRGHGQAGRRYAVVVQPNDLLALSTVVVCPTSRSAFAASFHPEIMIGDQSTQVLCEMVGLVDAQALGASRNPHAQRAAGCRGRATAGARSCLGSRRGICLEARSGGASRPARERPRRPAASASDGPAMPESEAA